MNYRKFCTCLINNLDIQERDLPQLFEWVWGVIQESPELNEMNLIVQLTCTEKETFKVEELPKSYFSTEYMCDEEVDPAWEQSFKDGYRIYKLSFIDV